MDDAVQAEAPGCDAGRGGCCDVSVEASVNWSGADAKYWDRFPGSGGV